MSKIYYLTAQLFIYFFNIKNVMLPGLYTLSACVVTYPHFKARFYKTDKQKMTNLKVIHLEH